jgi:sugar/nucleoside kinase (ribokinase family)
VEKRWDVLGIGCAAVDDLLYVAGYPGPDAKTPVEHSERQCGGLTATALVAAARQGARCRFAGALGQDELSDFVLQTLKDEGIDITPVARLADNGPIHSTIIVDRTANTRNIFFQRPAMVGAITNSPTDIQIQSAKVLFVDHYGGEQTVRVQEVARKAGVSIVGDLERNDLPCFWEILGNCDHLIISRDFAVHLIGDLPPAQTASSLLGPKVQVVIVTNGAEGCWSATRENRTDTRHPAFALETVDTTGCGDTFHGVYAAELSRDTSLAERIRRASAAAAIKATSTGAQKGIPTRQQVDQFLATQKNRE